ncbi:MAG: hypothetical protein HYS26_01115 [Candidatus Kaiserbacteria bacterium]|nr:MAG: hypothetical protein HYS26_01115 [Candidatus Kaiserbacteria bacterium]
MQPSIKIILSAVLILGALSFAAFYYFAIAPLSQPSDEGRPRAESLTEAMQKQLAGDRTGAYQSAQRQIAEGGTEEDTVLAKITAANSLFQIATTTEGRIAAMRILANAYSEGQSPQSKALVLNALVWTLIFNANTEPVTLAAFGFNEFQPFAVEGANGKSFQNLLKQSISLAPTRRAYYMRAVVASRELERNFAPDSAKLLSAASSDSVREIAQNILKFIEQGDALARAAPLDSGIEELDDITEAQNQIYRGLALSAVALVDSSQLSSALGAFQAVLDTARSGEPTVAVNVMAAYAHLYAGRIAAAVGGSANTAVARSHLADFAASAEASPKDYVKIYEMFQWLRGGASIPASEQAESRQYRLYQTYSSLAALSPDFKNFLASVGWQFE